MGTFLDTVPVSAIIKIRDLMLTLKDPFRLDQGDVSFDAPDSVKQAMAKAIADNSTHYLPTTGVPRLRQLLAEKLRTKNRIPDRERRGRRSDQRRHARHLGGHARAVRAGRRDDRARSGMAADDGDCHRGQGDAGRRAAARVRSAGAGISTSSSARSRRGRKRIYVNSPNNPTGGVLTRSDLERIAAIAARAQPVGDLGRSLRGHHLQRRARQHRVAAGDVRADDLRSSPSASRTR